MRQFHHDHFDKLAFRMQSEPDNQQMSFLETNSYFVDCRPGHPIRNSTHWLIVTVVAPKPNGLAFLGEQRKWLCNYVEPARNTFMPTTTAMLVRDEYDRTFVQPHHGRRETTSKGYSSRTDAGKGPGVQYAWYGDLLDKFEGQPCFHFEGRHSGLAAVRRIGIHQPGDLLTFDFASYFQRHLVFYEIDYERLGRFHRNRAHGLRRRRATVIESSAFAYNKDRRLGTMLYRLYGETRAFASFCDYVKHSDPEYEPMPKTRTIDRCVQRFVDRYGRGPYLQRRPDPALL